MTDTDERLARLNKRVLDKFRRGRDISKEYLPTASFGINLHTGGLGIGKQTTFFGNQSAGKSAMMLETIGINQKRGLGAVYFDVEKTFDYEWAERLGVNTDELLVSQISSIGEYTDLTSEAIKAGYELIIVDSTSTLMPDSFYDKDGELKDFDSTGQIGQFAKDLGKASRMVLGSNFTTAIAHISQVRMDLSGFMPTTKQSGGKETEHGDILRFKLFSSLSDKKLIHKPVQRGNKLIEEVVGRSVSWTIDKNKANGRYGNGSYDFYIQGDKVGVDQTGEMLDYAIKYGIIEQGGAWITVLDKKVQGRPAAVELLSGDAQLLEEIEAKIIEAFK